MVAVLIATLGTEPQVVTLTLGELVQHGPVNDVVVVHTAGQAPEIQAAVEILDDAFATDSRLRNYQYHRVLLKGPDGPLTDIATRDGVMALSQTLHQLVQGYKERGYTTLSISISPAVASPWPSTVCWRHNCGSTRRITCGT